MSQYIVERDLSYQVVGVAMQVHRELGPGLDEFYYHRALLHRFQAVNIHGRYRAKGKLIHKGEFADGFEADFIVENAMILELKHLEGEFCPAHYAQIISYLKHWNIRVGILMDFGKASFKSKRVVFTSPLVSPSLSEISQVSPQVAEDRQVLEAVCGSLVDLTRQFGLGYRATTYKALARIDLQSRGMNVRSPLADIFVDEQKLGASELKCLVINNQCVLCVHALQDKVRAVDRAIAQTYLKHLNLRWGLIANFGKKDFELRPVWLS